VSEEPAASVFIDYFYPENVGSRLLRNVGYTWKTIPYYNPEGYNFNIFNYTLNNCLCLKQTYPLRFAMSCSSLILLLRPSYCGNRDSGVDIATAYGLGDRGVGVRVPVGLIIFLLHVVQTGFGAHPSSYPMGIGAFLPCGKAAGA
jgi:hypothetical protein